LVHELYFCRITIAEDIITSTVEMELLPLMKQREHFTLPGAGSLIASTG